MINASIINGQQNPKLDQNCIDLEQMCFLNSKSKFKI